MAMSEIPAASAAGARQCPVRDERPEGTPKVRQLGPAPICWTKTLLNVLLLECAPRCSESGTQGPLKLHDHLQGDASSSQSKKELTATVT